jgi:hypothetical protein
MFAPGEELLARAPQHDHVHFVVHPRAQDAVIQLAVHLIRVGVGRRVVQLEDGHAFFHAIIDQGSHAAAF